jgi:hypothetical protein
MSEPENDEPADTGEVGGLLSSPDKIVSDCNLISRYPIHPKLRTRMVRVLAEIAECGRRRERIAAIRALTAMDKLNIEQEERGKGGGVTVNIVNQNQQAVVSQPGALVELSDADLMRIATASGGGVIETEGSPEPPT